MFTFIVIALIDSGIPALIFIPLVALLLWASTFISSSITFSWVFVAVVGGVLSLISGVFLAIKETS